MFKRLRSRIRAFSLRRSGVTAIEFSFIAGPFLLLVFGVIEISIAHMANTKLQANIQKIVRYVETGEGRCAKPADVVKRFCAELGGLTTAECSQNVRIAVMSLEDMNKATDLSFSALNSAYAPGESGDRMGVVAYQKHRAFFPYLGALVGRSPSDSAQTMLLQGVYIFKNEPFNASTPCA